MDTNYLCIIDMSCFRFDLVKYISISTQSALEKSSVETNVRYMLVNVMVSIA